MVKVLHIMNDFLSRSNLLSTVGLLAVKMKIHSKKIDSIVFFTGRGPSKGEKKYNICVDHKNFLSLIRDTIVAARYARVG